MYDIIPDIHGQSEKLRACLAGLGYQDRKGAWRHSDPSRTCVFLGDFIDRGPNNTEVIDIVRRMIDTGTAQAIMGNHELNAIQFHATDPATGDGYRVRSDKNAKQHRTFLNEFPLGSTAAAEAIAWMRTLPLYLELDDFRVVHACWDQRRIDRLDELTDDGLMREEQFADAANPVHELYDLLEATAKGPEHPLPEGYGFHDKDGVWREDIRVQWWARDAKTWADVAASVPNPSELPAGAPPRDILDRTYLGSAKPVFFGHYWLTGDPVLQAQNISAYVWRSVGDDHEPKRFKVWAPKCIAMIGKLPDTLEDRALVVPLRRKQTGETVERFRADKLSEFLPLRRRAQRWADDNLMHLHDMYHSRGTARGGSSKSSNGPAPCRTFRVCKMTDARGRDALLHSGDALIERPCSPQFMTLGSSGRDRRMASQTVVRRRGTV